MVSISKRGEAASFSLPDEQAEKLGLAKGGRYELVKVKDGFFVLHEAAAQKVQKPVQDHDSKIFSLLGAKKLAERVEGKFESLLDSAEKIRLKELVKEGRVVRFKLSDQYKKAVYKTKEEAEATMPKPRPSGTSPLIVPGRQAVPKAQAVEKPQAPPKSQAESRPEPQKNPAPAAAPAAAGVSQKPKEDYSLERDHFTVVSNDEAARRLSQRLSQEIRRKEVIGTKSFDGDYFVIKSSLYEKQAPAVLKLIKGSQEISAGELAERLRLDKQLVIAVCEFLKEEGDITERRREVYRSVE